MQKEQTDDRTVTKKIIDTVVMSSLTSLIASIVGGVAFYVYSQAQTATEDIRDIKYQLKTIHQDIEKTNEAIVEEIAPLKAEHEADNEKFNEITKFLQKIINESVSYKRGRRSELDAHNDPDNPFKLDIGGEG